MAFKNRADAGRHLAENLLEYQDNPDVIVLALPRGGVPVAYEVAYALNAPLDVFLVRKLGVPGQEELAFGAVATGGVRVLNRRLMEQCHITREDVDRVTQIEERELDRRERLYRGTNMPPELEGHIVILVDDGLATGASMYAAVEAMHGLNPAQIIVAVPVASHEAVERFRQYVGQVVCPVTPDALMSVGVWYHDFTQVTDAEVHALLSNAPYLR